MALSEKKRRELTREEVAFDLEAILLRQLHLDADAHGNRFEMSEEEKAVRLIFSEEGRRYDLVLSDSFIQRYPFGLGPDITRALSYLGEYLRSTENSRLLLTDSRAYEKWCDETLASSATP